MLTGQALREMTKVELTERMHDGAQPRLEDLVGFEFRGLNLPAITRALGIQKFRKGFFLPEAEIPALHARGYNVAVQQNGPDAPWIAKPSEEAPKRHGFYDVYPAIESQRFHAFDRALLIDYDVSENGTANPEKVIRDYLIQPDSENEDLFLGYAHLALGPLTVPFGFFVLERDRPTDFKG